MWSLSAIFYIYEFFLRVLPNVMQPELMRAFQLNPTEFSHLSASYYYAYALMQIPAGLCIDHYSIKYLLSFACLIVTLGNAALGNTENFTCAMIGRIAMGIGSAFAFTGCLKLAKQEFPSRKLSFMIGLTSTLGILGAISAELIFTMLLEYFNWRFLLNIGSLFGSGLMLSLWFSLEEANTPQPIQTIRLQFERRRAYHTILRDKKIWLTALYGALLVAPIVGFSELWSVPFLMNALNFASRTHDRKKILKYATSCASISLILIIFCYTLPRFIFILLLILFGFSTSAMLLIFTFNSQRYATPYVAFIIGLTNTLVMLIATTAQPVLGWLMTTLTQYVSNKIIIYQVALIPLLLAQITAYQLIPYLEDPQIR